MPMPELLQQSLPDEPDVIAPDGSEIRLLPPLQNPAASVVHCALPSGRTSKAISHKTVEEVWFFLSGTGEVWRRLESEESVTPVRAGQSLNIPLGAKFQFRNTGNDVLKLVIVTAPPWPGEDEARSESGFWEST